MIELVFFWFSLVTVLPSSLSVYPWDDSLQERSFEILSHLRDNLQLDIIGETIPKAFDNLPNNEIFIRNLEGVPFSAKMKSADSVDFKSQYSFLYDEEKLAARFEGICSVLPIEYWNYEWCHRREFSQFHLEQEGRRIIKAPDWSLGKYVRTVVVRDRSAESSSSSSSSPAPSDGKELTMDDKNANNAPIIKIVDYFQGGQICHENNQLRSVEVHVQCCDGEGIPNAIPSEAYTSFDQTHSSFPLAVLNRITEPELCAYQATVCSPLLCLKPKTSVNQDTKSRHPRFSDVMKQINTTCLAKQEEWWTYELCFNKGVRQVRFNLEQAVTAEGNVVQKQVLANQYILGLPNFPIYQDEEALVAMTQDKVFTTAPTSSSKEEGGAEEDLYSKEREMVRSFGLVSPLFRQSSNAHHKPNHLALEFSDGTACDLQQLNRSIVIEMYCGVNNVILQIREDSTCRYRMKVELTALCALPGFAPVKENITSIVLTPFYDPATLSDGSDNAQTKTKTSSRPSSSSSFPPPPTTNYEQSRQREAEERKRQFGVQGEPHEEVHDEEEVQKLPIDPDEMLYDDEAKEEVRAFVQQMFERERQKKESEFLNIDRNRERQDVSSSNTESQVEVEEEKEGVVDESQSQTLNNQDTPTVYSDDREDEDVVLEEVQTTITDEEELVEKLAAAIEEELEEVLVEVIEESESADVFVEVEFDVESGKEEEEIDAEIERVQSTLDDLVTQMEDILQKIETEEVDEGDSHPQQTQHTSEDDITVRQTDKEVVADKEDEEALKEEL